MPTEDATDHKWYMSTWVFDTPPEKVDADAGIIHGAAIVKEGEARGHGVMIDSEFIAETVRQGNASKHGVKARFGHPAMSSTALGTFLGRFKNFRADGPIARADLFLSTTAKETPQGDLYSYVLRLADDDANAFGNSIVFERAPSKFVGEDEDIVEYARMQKLLAADVVDDPAATDGLFGAWNESTVAGQVAEFLDTHPQVLDLIARKPEIMASFMERYDAYRARRNEGQTTMPDETTDVADAADAVDSTTTQDVDATADADTTDALSADPQNPDPEALAQQVEDDADDDTDPTRDEFARMVTDFGVELTAEVFANGGGYDEARELWAEHVADENAQLRQDLAELRQAAAGEEQGAAFCDADAPTHPAQNARHLTAAQRFAAKIKSEITTNKGA